MLSVLPQNIKRHNISQTLFDARVSSCPDKKTIKNYVGLSNFIERIPIDTIAIDTTEMTSASIPSVSFTLDVSKKYIINCICLSSDSSSQIEDIITMKNDDYVSGDTTVKFESEELSLELSVKNEALNITINYSSYNVIKIVDIYTYATRKISQRVTEDIYGDILKPISPEEALEYIDINNTYVNTRGVSLSTLQYNTTYCYGIQWNKGYNRLKMFDSLFVSSQDVYTSSFDDINTATYSNSGVIFGAESTGIKYAYTNPSTSRAVVTSTNITSGQVNYFYNYKNNILACMSTGTYISTDEGLNWTQLDSSPSTRINSNDTYYIVCTSAGLKRVSISTKSVTTISSSITECNDIQYIKGNFYICTNTCIYKLPKDSTTLTTINRQNVLHIRYFNSMYILGTTTGIIYSKNMSTFSSTNVSRRCCSLATSYDYMFAIVPTETDSYSKSADIMLSFDGIKWLIKKTVTSNDYPNQTTYINNRRFNSVGMLTTPTGIKNYTHTDFLGTYSSSYKNFSYTLDNGTVLSASLNSSGNEATTLRYKTKDGTSGYCIQGEYKVYLSYKNYKMPKIIKINKTYILFYSQVIASEDGITWRPLFNKATTENIYSYANGYYYLYGKNYIYRTKNLLSPSENWEVCTISSSETSTEFQAVHYVNNKYFAISKTMIYYSTDGRIFNECIKNWTMNSVSTRTQPLIFYVNNTYYLNTNIKSSDGITWENSVESFQPSITTILSIKGNVVRGLDQYGYLVTQTFTYAGVTTNSSLSVTEFRILSDNLFFGVFNNKVGSLRYSSIQISKDGETWINTCIRDRGVPNENSISTDGRFIIRNDNKYVPTIIPIREVIQ